MCFSLGENLLEKQFYYHPRVYKSFAYFTNMSKHYYQYTILVAKFKINMSCITNDDNNFKRA